MQKVTTQVSFNHEQLQQLDQLKQFTGKPIAPVMNTQIIATYLTRFLNSFGDKPKVPAQFFSGIAENVILSPILTEAMLGHRALDSGKITSDFSGSVASFITSLTEAARTYSLQMSRGASTAADNMSFLQMVSALSDNPGFAASQLNDLGNLRGATESAALNLLSKVQGAGLLSSVSGKTVRTAYNPIFDVEQAAGLMQTGPNMPHSMDDVPNILGMRSMIDNYFARVAGAIDPNKIETIDAGMDAVLACILYSTYQSATTDLDAYQNSFPGFVGGNPQALVQHLASGFGSLATLFLSAHVATSCIPLYVDLKQQMAMLEWCTPLVSPYYTEQISLLSQRLAMLEVTIKGMDGLPTVSRDIDAAMDELSEVYGNASLLPSIVADILVQDSASIYTKTPVKRNILSTGLVTSRPILPDEAINLVESGYSDPTAVADYLVHVMNEAVTALSATVRSVTGFHTNVSDLLRSSNAYNTRLTPHIPETETDYVIPDPRPDSIEGIPTSDPVTQYLYPCVMPRYAYPKGKKGPAAAPAIYENTYEVFDLSWVIKNMGTSQPKIAVGPQKRIDIPGLLFRGVLEVSDHTVGTVATYPVPHQYVHDSYAASIRARSTHFRDNLNASVLSPSGYTTWVDSVTRLAASNNGNTPIRVAHSIAGIGFLFSIEKLQLIVSTGSGGSAIADSDMIVGPNCSTIYGVPTHQFARMNFLFNAKTGKFDATYDELLGALENPDDYSDDINSPDFNPFAGRVFTDEMNAKGNLTAPGSTYGVLFHDFFPKMDGFKKIYHLPTFVFPGGIIAAPILSDFMDPMIYKSADMMAAFKALDGYASSPTSVDLLSDALKLMTSAFGNIQNTWIDISLFGKSAFSKKTALESLFERVESYAQLSVTLPHLTISGRFVHPAGFLSNEMVAARFHPPMVEMTKMGDRATMKVIRTLNPSFAMVDFSDAAALYLSREAASFGQVFLQAVTSAGVSISSDFSKYVRADGSFVEAFGSNPVLKTADVTESAMAAIGGVNLASSHTAGGFKVNRPVTAKEFSRMVAQTQSTTVTSPSGVKSQSFDHVKSVSTGTSTDIDLSDPGNDHLTGDPDSGSADKSAIATSDQKGLPDKLEAVRDKKKKKQDGDNSSDAPTDDELDAAEIPEASEGMPAHLSKAVEADKVAEDAESAKVSDDSDEDETDPKKKKKKKGDKSDE